MYLRLLWLLQLCALLFNVISRAEKRERCDEISENACSCIMSDGNAFTLMSLTEFKMSTKSPFGLVFNYDPCFGVACLSGGGVVPICYKYDRKKTPLAKFDGAIIDIIDDKTPIITYKSNLHETKVEVEITCDRLAEAPEFSCKDCELTSEVLLFELKTNAICDFIDRMPKPKITPVIKIAGMSAGSCLLIIAFAGATIYLILGAGYEFLVKQSRGAELLPHKEFWSGVVDNIKLGASFIKAKMCGGTQEPYESFVETDRLMKT